MPTSDSVEEHWKEWSESDICQAMKDLGRWQTSLEKLSTAFREYGKSSTASGGDPGYNTHSDDLEEIRIKVKEVTIAVNQEDVRRNLQTLRPTKSDKVTYPKFSGEPGEDF